MVAAHSQKINIVGLYKSNKAEGQIKLAPPTFIGGNMRNDKKIAYRQKRINKLIERVRILEQENTNLKQENESLKKINEMSKRLVNDLQSRQREVMDNYNVGIAQIQELKENYRFAIKFATNIRKEYENKMQILMQRYKRQQV